MVSPHSVELPFRLRGRNGWVRVRIEENQDPVGLGHALIAQDFDRTAFLGFPVTEAVVEFDGQGPLAWMGWLQVVTRTDSDGTTTVEVDADPLLGGVSPLYVFGYKPTFADAPANPDHPDCDWKAEAFLVSVPDVVRSRVLSFVTGFQWGYVLRSSIPVELHRPEPLNSGSWNSHRGLLTSEFADWTFELS